MIIDMTVSSMEKNMSEVKESPWSRWGDSLENSSFVADVEQFNNQIYGAFNCYTSNTCNTTSTFGPTVFVSWELKSDNGDTFTLNG